LPVSLPRNKLFSQFGDLRVLTTIEMINKLKPHMDHTQSIKPTPDHHTDQMFKLKLNHLKIRNVHQEMLKNHQDQEQLVVKQTQIHKEKQVTLRKAVVVRKAVVARKAVVRKAVVKNQVKAVGKKAVNLRMQDQEQLMKKKCN